ncbi:MAG: aminotransferase class III-fold pyridoxal phosphate-dependent enzyme [Magnetococcales bacterium]|nr:aminotransferase class III-fold pyridoxal phosphate-dependent enzyme [Magnetococcales bacterium]
MTRVADQDSASPLELSRSNALWPETIKAIPAGVQTFSKAPSQHVEGVSPCYTVKGKGCRSWDLDDNIYIDYMMGLGPIVLGFADEEVNRAAMEGMSLGVVASLAHPLETKLSQKLIELIPCAEMVRFGKNGTDVTSAAVRAARGFTKRNKVAVCGYHGWQDWYIGSTPRNMGVPESIQALTLKFQYNNIKSLHALFQKHPGEIAAVIMEPVNFYEPEDDFLSKVKELTHKNGALLVFDEVITGFRMNIGGAQKEYGVTPDLASFGKAMANGFPISAVVGRSDVMEIFDKVFFSATFGGDLPSISAALATIEAMEQRQTLSHIHAMGARLKTGYASIVQSLGIEKITRMIGFDWWPEYLFFNTEGKASREIQSLFQQEIVRRGVLTRAGMMLCGAHQKEDIDQTLHVFEQALFVVKDAVRTESVLERLDGPVIQPVIRKVD